MIFESLMHSAELGELLLIPNGYCRYHIRRDGQLTIYEIISLEPGRGSEMLSYLRGLGASSILARCPADLPANDWYRKRGFVLDRVEKTRSGRELNVWVLS